MAYLTAKWHCHVKITDRRACKPKLPCRLICKFYLKFSQKLYPLLKRCRQKKAYIDHKVLVVFEWVFARFFTATQVKILKEAACSFTCFILERFIIERRRRKYLWYSAWWGSIMHFKVLQRILMLPCGVFLAAAAKPCLLCQTARVVFIVWHGRSINICRRCNESHVMSPAIFVFLGSDETFNLSIIKFYSEFSLVFTLSFFNYFDKDPCWQVIFHKNFMGE